MAALIVCTLCSLSVPFWMRLRLRHLADVCLNCQVSFSIETAGEIKVRLATPAAPGCHLIPIPWQWRSGRFKENRGRGRCLATTKIRRYHLQNLAGGCEYDVTVVEAESGIGETGWNPTPSLLHSFSHKYTWKSIDPSLPSVRRMFHSESFFRSFFYFVGPTPAWMLSSNLVSHYLSGI